MVLADLRQHDSYCLGETARQEVNDSARLERLAIHRIQMSGRALARAPLGGGFPASPFRLRSGFTVPPQTTFPAALPKIPYVRFSRVRLQASGTLQFEAEPSAIPDEVKTDPAIPPSVTTFAPPLDNATHRVIIRLCVQIHRL